jgi:outer membrane lipoprotein-sorting protein
MRNLLIILISLLIALPGVAQDFKQTMKAIRAEYENASSLQLEMLITVYDSAQTVPYYTQTVEVLQKGDNYFYQLEESEMLLNDEYLIMVDNASRIITFTKRNQEVEREMKRSLTFNVDSVLALYDDYQFLGTDQGADHYLVKEKKGPISDIHFYLLPAQRKLRQITYHYRAGQIAKIHFENFRKDVALGAEAFSESKYVTRVNKKVVAPAARYKHYSINYQ